MRAKGSDLQALMDDISALQEELERTRAMLAALVKNVGSNGICKGCGAEILWIRHEATSGRNAPYNVDGTTHWGTCPVATQFKRKDSSHGNRNDTSAD